MTLHIITNFVASAGAETMLARLLQRAEERTVVVSLIGVSERNRLLANNPHVEFVSLNMKSLGGLLGATPRLAALLRKERSDTILCWMYHAMIAGALVGKSAAPEARLFWNVRQSLDDPLSMSKSSRGAVWAARQLSNRVDGVIYNSARALDLHARYGFTNKNAAVIPNGFDLPPPPILLPKQPTTFGIAARFHPQKDHETFFRAAAEVLKTHPGARFVAAGKGLTAKNPGVAALVGAARVPSEALDLRDEVANMAEFYQSIDALCLSSRTEGFPNVIAEAMSYGRPAVTTDVGDAAAIVADAGFVAPPKDPMALAAAMRRILDLDPEAYASLARRARSRIETHYSLDRVAAHYAAFLNADRPEAIGAASRARS